MRAWLLLALLLCLPAAADKLTDSPPNVPLPVRVSVGVKLIKLESIDEAAGTFSATIDLRLAWTDPRLAAGRWGKQGGARQLGSRGARVSLGEIWEPGVKMQNARGEWQDQIVDEALWVSDQGEVEWIRRIRGTFEGSFDTRTFPFDRQDLSFQLVGAEYGRDQVALVSDEAAQRFSQGSLPTVEIWKLGRGAVSSKLVSHWNGTTHSALAYDFTARRDPWRYVAPIFTPVMATLVVPILVIWLERWAGNKFQIEAFEFMNLAVGGLFATIALTLAIYSSYPFLASGRNVVGHLFTLNYELLALDGLIILALFRYQREENPLFSPGVARELYRGVCWAMPLAALIAVTAIFVTALP